MKSALSFLLFFTCTAFAHDFPEPELDFAGANLVARTAWITPPTTKEEARLRIEWRDPKRGATEPAGKFKVVLWMPDMGHGSAPTKLQRVLDQTGKQIPGAYDVTNMHFTMRGMWEVRVELTTPQGKETQLFNVEL